MALLERLQILIDADGKGAVREFQKVGDAAGKAAATADDRFKRMGSTLTTFGAGAVAASAVSSVALYKLADSASAVSEQVSAAGVVFGDEYTPQLKEFASQASKTAGISKTLALQMSNNFGTLGKQAGFTGDELVGFSTKLTQLGGDLASFKDTSVEEALAAIQSGLQGESEPLRRFGVFLSDAKLKQEALSQGIYDGNGALTDQQKIVAAYNVILKETTDAQGDFTRTSDSLANRQRQLAADFENTKAAVGEGLVPIFETLLGATGSVVDGFQQLSPEAQKLVGTLGGIAAIGTGAAGGLSLLVGFGLQSIDTFRDLGARMRDAEGNSTRLGRSLRGLAIGAGVVGGAIALDAALNKASVNAVKLDSNLNRIKGARTASEALSELIERTRELDGWWSDTKSLFGGGVGRLVEINGVTVDVNNLGTALEDVRSSGDLEALRLQLEGLKKANITEADMDVLTRSGGGTPGLDRTLGLLDEYTDYVDSADAANSKAALSAAGMDASWQGVIKTLTAGQSPTKKAAAASEDLATQVEDVGLNAKLAAVGIDAMSERASSFSKSLESSTNIDDLLSAGLSYRGGLDGFFEKIGALPKELDVAKVALGGYTDAQHDALSVLAQAGDASQKYLTSLLEQGLGADNVRVMAAGMWDQYRKVFEQLGLNEEQTRQYQEILGLTPEQVETAISLSGLDEAIFKIETYSKLLEDEIPDSVKTQLLAQLEQGDLTGAAETYDAWVRFMQATAAGNPLILPTEVDTTPATAGLDLWRSLTGQAPPANTQVGADTDPATSQVFLWRQLQASMAVEVPVKAKIDGSWRGVIGALTGGGIPSAGKTNRVGEGVFTPGGAFYPGSNGKGGVDFNFLTPRASGGPVSPNETYLVGEKGPEVFRPKMAGDIIPNHQIGVAAQQQPAGTVINIDTVNTNSVEELPAEMSRSALRLKALLG